ncbi:MAG: DinB family protein [Ignavibacteria bacterium]
MKELLKDYTKYNIWANERICKVLEPLGSEILDKEIKSSFPGIRKTIYHIWDAETIWYKRLNGKSLHEWPSEVFKGSFLEFQNEFLGGSGKFFMYVINKEKKDLEKELTYKNVKGMQFTSKICHILQHVVNHSTFHRGQIITMLRNAGVTELPVTDFIAFTREDK